MKFDLLKVTKKVLNFIGEVGGSGSDYPSPSKSDEWSTSNKSYDSRRDKAAWDYDPLV